MRLLLAGESSSDPRGFLLLLVLDTGEETGSDLGAGGGDGTSRPDPIPPAGIPVAPPLLPFAPPFRNLLCTDDRVSVKLLRSPGAAARPRFPRPLGVLASNSSVGESQNLKA